MGNYCDNEDKDLKYHIDVEVDDALFKKKIEAASLPKENIEDNAVSSKGKIEDDIALSKDNILEYNKESKEKIGDDTTLSKEKISDPNMVSKEKIEDPDEKSKEKIDKMFNKFLSLDENKNVKICEVAQEDYSNLVDLLNNIPNQYYFLNKLNNFRAKKQIIPENVLNLLVEVFTSILNKLEKNFDSKIFDLVTVLSNTFSYTKDSIKVYILDKLEFENNKIIQSSKNWKAFLKDKIDEETEKSLKGKENAENAKKEEIKKNAILVQMMSVTENMKICKVKKTLIEAILEEAAKEYDLDEGTKNILNSILNE